MKRTIILLITVCLVLICSLPATAKATVYFEKMVSGSIDEEFGNDTAFDTDSTINIIGMEWAGRRFVIRGEMGVDMLRIPQKVDFNTSELIMGVRLKNKERFKWNLDFCYQSTELEIENTTQHFSGSMGGMDFVFGSRKSNLSLLLLMPFSGTSNNKSYSNVALLAARLKYCYLFNETLGISVDYRFDSINWDYPQEFFGSYYPQGAEIARQGFLLGLTYQF
ncbi:MAG: hypothetical protein GX075_05610 [Firmicutes bacterium]|nr:hypothetical protein [Bacillota bacterium]